MLFDPAGSTTTTTFLSLLAGVVSGIGVALLNHVLGRRKTAAEIRNLEAQAEKIQAETGKILAEVQKLSDTVSYTLAAEEAILVDGRSRAIDGFDTHTYEATLWQGSGSQAVPVGLKAKGRLIFDEGGVLNIQRENTDGRFELLFQRYLYKGKEHPLIPKDDLLQGKRKLRVSFEAKCVGGAHTLRFIIRDPASGRWLAQYSVRVDQTTWTPCQAFLVADADVPTQLRIDDEDLSAAPSSVQIRNLVIGQRLS